MPVCSPDFLTSHGPFVSARDLVGVNLLHDDSPDNDPSCPTWEMWLRAAGVVDLDLARGPRFNQSSLVIEAAVLGRGVALAKTALAAQDLRSKRLVQPFPTSLAVDFAYFVVAPPPKLNLPKVTHFIEWLRREAEQHDRQLAVA